VVNSLIFSKNEYFHSLGSLGTSVSLSAKWECSQSALRRELSASYARHPGSAKDTKKIERRMFPGLRHASF